MSALFEQSTTLAKKKYPVYSLGSDLEDMILQKEYVFFVAISLTVVLKEI